MSAVNATATPRLVLKVELTCLYCGHSCGEVKVRTSGRPTYRDIRQAFADAPTASVPDWDAHGAPRCPRCRGKLFIEESERRAYVPGG
jgi:anaerobic selenocysteine-containing dehydrogenase